MNFASVRIITDNVDGLVAFYEHVLGVSAERPAPVFAQFVLPSCTLAIGHTQTTALFGTDSANAAGATNHPVILEFHVADIEAEYERLNAYIHYWVQQPTTMPWGNRSMLFRDPDGNLVNFFEPVTEEAIQRFNQRH
ncbi:putative enzyme related to lactoylglutathione lyase [Paenibacillus sp. JGP012]|uniref:VOC family protein n=1 Tax=Paenibacillus sp. JGP012 TaxID=2735914 RepID=UPI001607A32A|nr:VOC family protein [Paenibacillus sp. JGP012]MBB6019490.1 putative enzyme related to lactoylglutathione lyase [Paenibacillus sp. JGP012]